MTPGGREYVLGASALPGGVERTLLLCVRPSGLGGPTWIDIVERHRNGVPGWSGRDRRFAVTARLDEVAPLATLVETRLGLTPAGVDPAGGDPAGVDPAGGDPAARLAAALTAAAQRGDLAGDLAPMGMRRRVAEWCTQAGVPHRQNNWLPIVQLAPGLSLWFDLDDRGLDDPGLDDLGLVKLIARAGNEQTVEVSIAYTATATVISHLEREYGPSGYDGHPDDQLSHLVAVLTGRLGGGQAGGDRTAGTSADQVAAWYAACGVPYQRSGERRHSLLHTDRENTSCTFTLTLGISSREDRIWFSENYDYHARPGDAGREYAYSVKTPYGSLDRLVAYLATRVDLAGDGHGDPEDRLLACFTELVRRGDLAGDRPAEANRDRVAGWFREAGVPAEPDFWMWTNSD